MCIRDSPGAVRLSAALLGFEFRCILPLHKKGALSDCGRCRGIELAAQISKVVGRFLAPFCAEIGQARSIWVSPVCLPSGARRSRFCALCRVA
eukprot:9416588-Pyramimonas_sp.AAC.1